MALGRYTLFDSGWTLNTTFTTLAVNSSNGSAGAIFAFEGGHGAITGVIFNATAITTPPTYTVSLQGVTSRGTPNGTVYGGGTATGTVIPAVGVNSVTLGTAYSGTPGDQIAIVINSASAAAGANATIAVRTTIVAGVVQSPYAIQQVAGTWSAQNGGPPSVAPIYNDGYIGTGFLCPSSIASVTPNNTTSTSNYLFGNGYTPTIARGCNGVYVSARFQSGSDFVVSVYSGPAASATLIGSSPVFVIDKMTGQANLQQSTYVPLSASLSLAANTTYWFVLNMNSATTFISMYVPTFSVQAHRESYSGGLFGATATNAASFTSSQTTIYPVYPAIQSETASSGGGVMFQRGMSGGFSA